MATGTRYCLTSISWRLAADFDFRKGGLLAIGVAVLLVAPLLAAKLQGLV